ncbi:MAG: hypothetical protein COW01_03210 [Bdellovibrionales bacterium CG12_big_fil_rev_8_21_14_0_65_38_15]|nr:MAG: hypothetical protein COW79_12450 [Bdellovibrionales bacterium CG22_combo_CG10-13_8_21_14_all_38_13]PIQ56854.1 MAG: hypothetical protein COW01_03210 [Bdellovibrionales bacterium CG12_big_fil_rev_8_21_14_0_65_38_15]PIR30019.1 MAG: hypothetical protein COV38_06930 [Bdellovibrionales bacterium CG11_big_fil_rev_8_21_14_0_20_38_13]
MKNIILLFLFVASIMTTNSQTHFGAPFDGERFENLEPVPDKPLTTLLKWKFSEKAKDWPTWVESNAGSILKERTEKGEIHWNVINHATVLIQIDGINIITDPIWSDRTSPVSFAGPKRVRAPGLNFEDLPAIDFVLISHNHYDHLDLPTLTKLKEKFNPTFIVGLRNRELLESEGIDKILEMDWWQQLDLNNLKFHFVPAQHWSARGMFDKRKALWGGFMIEGTSRVYFAGDTGWGKFFEMIRDRIGAPDLSFIPIGAYAPRWFMKNFHINPDESVRAHKALQSKQSVGIHFGTFQLTNEAIDDPIKDLNKAKSEHSVDHFDVPVFGETQILTKE